MENRSDRIHFPTVDADELWSGVKVNSPLISPVDEEKTEPFFEIACTPIISSTPFSSSEEDGVEYFKHREREGLVTPAKTPSDILFRGPLFVGDVSDAESDVSDEINSPAICSNLGRELLEKAPHVEIFRGETAGIWMSEIDSKIVYHRERQVAIVKAIEDYTRKMTDLLNWHRSQEAAFLEGEMDALSRTQEDTVDQAVEIPAEATHQRSFWQLRSDPVITTAIKLDKRVPNIHFSNFGFIVRLSVYRERAPRGARAQDKTLACENPLARITKSNAATDAEQTTPASTKRFYFACLVENSPSDKSMPKRQTTKGIEIPVINCMDDACTGCCIMDWIQPGNVVKAPQNPTVKAVYVTGASDRRGNATPIKKLPNKFTEIVEPSGKKIGSSHGV